MKLTESQKNFRKQMEETEREKLQYRIQALKSYSTADENHQKEIAREIKSCKKQLKRVGKGYNKYRWSRVAILIFVGMLSFGFFSSIYMQESYGILLADESQASFNLTNDVMYSLYKTRRNLSRTFSLNGYEFQQKNAAAEYLDLMTPMKYRRNDALDYLESEAYETSSSKERVEGIEGIIRDLDEDIELVDKIIPPVAMEGHFAQVRELFRLTRDYFETYRVIEVNGETEENYNKCDEAWLIMSGVIDAVHDELIAAFDKIGMDYYEDDYGTVHYSYDDYE